MSTGPLRTASQLRASWPLGLRRRFSILVFDWDGTAVENRAQDAAPVRQRLERLLQLNTTIVVVSGTNADNIDRQLSAQIYGAHKRRLFLCTNRGSETYGFDADSQMIPLFARKATGDEDHMLSTAAKNLRADLVDRTGLEIHVIEDRLNRRKVDLIPLPEWADPPKSRIGELRQAVEARLQGAGVHGGLAEIVHLAEDAASAAGLADARVTSDVKHVEIGLTDKSDSMHWVMHELADPGGISIHDMLVGGDEFGPVAATPGSDSLMMIPETAGAVFVSVGPEPYGLPDGVLHLPGGPPRFLQLLDLQLELHRPEGIPS